MPTFEVEAHGRRFEIEAPDIQAATAALAQHMGGSPASTSDGGFDLGDLARSAGIGLVKGAVGVAGLPGDLVNLATRGVDFLTGAETNKEFGQTVGDYAGGAAMRGYLENVTGPLYEPKTTAGRYAQNVAEFAPAMVGGPGSLATRALTRAVIPGAASEAAGQVTEGSAIEPYARVAGAIGGALAPGMVSRAITPNPIAAERAAAVNELRKEGVTGLTASMVTGRKGLKAAESELSPGLYDDAVTRVGEQFTAAALRRAGINADRATPDVINAAEDRIGKVFEAVAKRNPSIPLDSRWTKEAQQVADDFKNLTGAPSPLIDGLIQRVASTGQKPAISGESYQTLQSEIARYARAAQVPELRMALQDLRSSLDAAIQRGLRNPADLREWKRARRQWANMMVINRAVSTTTQAAADGFITPARLTQAIESMKRGTYSHGRGDFASIARAGNQVMKGLQDSGTPSRARALAVPAMAGAVLGGGFGMLPGAAMAAVAPAVAGRAVMSRPGQAYLRNQLMSGTDLGTGRNVATQSVWASATEQRRKRKEKERK